MADEVKSLIEDSPDPAASPQSMGDADTASGSPPLSPDTNLDVPTPDSESVDAPGLSMGEQETLKPAASVDDSSLSALAEIDRKVFAERFDFIAELGAGGMGRVLKAFDRKMGREVAVKRIKGNFADGSKLWIRFLREAKLAARLSHPNLVTVHDILADDEGPYLVLEYIDGESLAERLKRGPFSEWREAVKLLLPVCLGVAAAHERGVVHRDIKPGNILLPLNGYPKLGDFGIARASDSTDLTRTQVSLGTPDYMAPEQGLGTKDVDSRADLYSLAATLYHMVTGNRPRLILVEDVPDDLRPIVRQGLQQNREKRQESVLAFAEQLERCLTPQVVLSDPDVAHPKDGQCPQCRTINKLTNKFCTKCKSPLQEPCPKCQHTTNVWDTGCGECGVDIADAWKSYEQDITGKSERFYAFAAEHDYPAATGLLDEIGALNGQRWSKWRTWAAESRTWLETERADRIRWRDDLVSAAQLDFEEARYEEAATRLRQIPASLLSPENEELLKRALARQEELTRLLTELRDCLETKDYPAIRRCVDAIFAISPDDQRILELDQQLRDREEWLQRQAQCEAEKPLPLYSPFSTEVARAGQEAWAKFLGVSLDEKNSIGLELTLIPPGEFLMGSPLSEERRRKNESQLAVRLTKPFQLGKYPVLQREFRQVLGRNPSHFSPAGDGKGSVEGVDCDLLPVEQVSWFDAIEFCNQLSELEGLPLYYKLSNVQRDEFAIKSADVKLVGGNGYRLPTEAEWEYACRAGTTSPFHFGNVNNGQETNVDGNYPDGTTTKGPSLQRTSVVGSYSANAFGLHDMHGNVREWCGDGYDPGFYGNKSGPVVDPCYTSPTYDRVLRGGSWVGDARHARSANRGRSTPEFKDFDGGFRVARTVTLRASHIAVPRIVVPQELRPSMPSPLKAPFSAEAANAGQRAWAKFLGKSVVEFLGRSVVEQNSIGLELSLIPPGEFLMGSPDSEPNREDDEMQHPVRLTQPFRLGTYPVLQREFEKVLGRNPSHFSQAGDGKESVQGVDSTRLPVERVSWFDAVEFCNQLSELEGLPPYYELSNLQRVGAAIKSADVQLLGGNGYRLPTEAEWEYACRAGAESAYHFGNANNGEEANVDGNYPDDMTATGTYLQRTSVAGSYPANGFGLYDMHGNVWEWSGDWYDAEFYSQTGGTAVNPFNSIPANFRVLRGGSWYDYAWKTRSSVRSWSTPDDRDDNIGFRVARTEALQSSQIAPPRIVVKQQTRPASPARLKAPFSPEAAQTGQEAWAKFLGKSVVEQNSIGLEMTLIPPGEFLMGSSDADVAAALAADANMKTEYMTDERPQHAVRLMRPFWMGTYPVLQGEFQQVLGRNPSYFSPGVDGKAEVERVDFWRLPVEQVSWFDAVEFCNKLSEREQLAPYYALSNVQRDGGAIKSADVMVSGGNGYRLPTEAEWEYACRAGTSSPFHFGNVNNGAEANVDGNYPFGTTTKGPYLQRTSVVGSYAPNGYGLYDMHGNVWEWCGDWYDAGFYGQTNGIAIDPFNATSSSFRVLRGGSGASSARLSRAAYRDTDSPDYRDECIGLRIARTE